jgi:hypothetical protein
MSTPPATPTKSACTTPASTFPLGSAQGPPAAPDINARPASVPRTVGLMLEIRELREIRAIQEVVNLQEVSRLRELKRKAEALFEDEKR